MYSINNYRHLYVCLEAMLLSTDILFSVMANKSLYVFQIKHVLTWLFWLVAKFPHAFQNKIPFVYSFYHFFSHRGTLLQSSVVLFLVTAWIILTCWASFRCTESIDVIMIELWYQTWFVLDFELSSFLMKVFYYAFHFIRYALIRLWICLPFFNIIEFKLWSYEAVRAWCSSVHCTAITNENLML